MSARVITFPKAYTSPEERAERASQWRIDRLANMLQNIIHAPQNDRERVISARLTRIPVGLQGD